jgi:kynureninase
VDLDGRLPGSREECLGRDEEDPLREVVARFHKPRGVIYLDGNSLGAMPRGVGKRIDDVVSREWGEDLITSWNKAGWFDLPLTLGNRIGQLIGAAPGQTVVTDTTSINIYKCLHAALSLKRGRRVVVSEAQSFPTDLYMIEGVVETAAAERRLWDRREPIETVLNENVAAVLLSEVDYRTGALIDAQAITRKVHEAGALMIWDLCHSAGVLEVALDRIGADFAVGCTYKYLNGGPGAPAFLYAAKRHHEGACQPLTGWWGHARPFAFERDFAPASGIRKFLCGTQPILSLAGVAAGLDAMAGAAVPVLRRKSQALAGLFIERVDALLRDKVDIVTPREPARRGSQVSIRFEQGYAVVQAMIAKGVIGDFRAPDIMRFGFSPLYTTYTEVWDAAEVLRSCIESEPWREERFTRRAAVT